MANQPLEFLIQRASAAENALAEQLLDTLTAALAGRGLTAMQGVAICATVQHRLMQRMYPPLAVAANGTVTCNKHVEDSQHGAVPDCAGHAADGRAD